MTWERPRLGEDGDAHGSTAPLSSAESPAAAPCLGPREPPPGTDLPREGSRKRVPAPPAGGNCLLMTARNHARPVGKPPATGGSSQSAPTSPTARSPPSSKATNPIATLNDHS